MDRRDALLVIALASALVAGQEPKPCECDQESEYKPFCGSDDVTYINKCHFECFESRYSLLKLKYEGKCGKAPCGCPKANDPYCATDGETYPSKCTFMCQKREYRSLEIKHRGPCLREKCTCGTEDQPVCGTDGLTYSSVCVLNCAALANTEIELQSEGACVALAYNIGRSNTNASDSKESTNYVKDGTGDKDAKVKPLGLILLDQGLNTDRRVSCTCTREFAPVCGDDGITYSNTCLLRCNGATKVKEGAC